MKASIPQVREDHFISSLFGPSARALTPVEARLLARALGSLDPQAQRLTFQVAFEDVLPGGSAGGRQYTALEEAQTRLTRPLKYETIQQGRRSSEYTVLFTILSLDEDTEQITGEFNPHLRAYWLELAGAFTSGELESRLLPH